MFTVISAIKKDSNRLHKIMGAKTGFERRTVATNEVVGVARELGVKLTHYEVVKAACYLTM